MTAWTFEVLDWLKGLRTAPARRKPTPVADAAEGPDTHLLGTWQVRVYVVERPQSPVIVATVRGHRQEAQAYVYPILKEGLVVHHPSGQATHYPATSVERIEVERIDPNKAEAGEW